MSLIGALPWRTPRLVVGHSCVASWWERVKGEAAPDAWERYRQEVRRGLQAADLVVAPTRAMLSALERHYGPLANSRVVPNGRDPALFPPGAKEPFILVAGRLWDEAKNVALVDKVAPSLPWPVYIAGEDHHPAGGQAHFRAVEPLRQLGASALSRWLARAAIFALPARYEPFGLSILEAGLAGYTLVLGDIPSLREVGDDAAAFVPPDDADGLAGTLQTLIQNPAHLTGLAAAARRRALRFTSQRMCADYLRVYRELLQDGQRQRRDGGARAISTSRGDRAIGGLRNGA